MADDPLSLSDEEEHDSLKIRPPQAGGSARPPRDRDHYGRRTGGGGGGGGGAGRSREREHARSSREEPGRRRSRSDRRREER